MRKTTLLALITLCLPVMAQIEKAEWISVKDAPLATGKASVINRAADGASWFGSTPCQALCDAPHTVPVPL